MKNVDRLVSLIKVALEAYKIEDELLDEMIDTMTAADEAKVDAELDRMDGIRAALEDAIMLAGIDRKTAERMVMIGDIRHKMYRLCGLE